jgi:hypothetical protein
MRSLTLSSLLKSSAYWSRHAIIRWQLVIFLAVGWGLIRWFRAEYSQDDSNLWLVMNIFILLAQWSIIGLVSISIFSTLVKIGRASCRERV